MANIFKTLDYKNKTTRSPFDLSQRVSFTAKAGEILPVWWDLTYPGDHYKGQLKHFTRTQPVNTAALTTVKEEFKFYYVPMSQLWKNFKPVITQMTSESQTATSLTTDLGLSSRTPYITVANLFDKDDGLLNTIRSTFKENIDAFGFNANAGIMKLLQYLRYGGLPDKYANPDVELPYTIYDKNVPLTPFPLLAYQKIYFDKFRFDQWEENSAYCWNIDYNDGEELDVAGLLGPSVFGNCLLTLRYANYPKDLFFGILPNSQYGDVSTLSYDTQANINIPSQLANVTAQLFDNQNQELYVQQFSEASGAKFGGLVNEQDEGVGKSPLLVKGTANVLAKEALAHFTSKFSILALREAEAMQKWKEISQSGKKNYKDQIYKHWNVTLPENESGECVFAGGTTSFITINEVVSSVIDIDQNQLANIAGKGIGSSEGNIDFVAPDYGVFMCVYTAVPRVSYDLDGIDMKLLKTDAADYAIPEFDKIGMETLPSICFSMSKTLNSLESGVMGYVPRYIDAKTNVDIVLGAFKTTLHNWVTPVSAKYFEEYFEVGQNVNKNFFKVNPKILNPIFPVEMDSFTETDPFIIDANFSINCVRRLDYNGMPY